MENENTSKQDSLEKEIFTYECLSEFRKPLIDSIIQYLNIPNRSKGLDAACGIGFITKILALHVGKNGKVSGLDFSKKLIDYAKQNNQIKNVKFVEADINALPFNDDSFDWIWSMDSVWPGPEAFGCPAEEPSAIINEFYRVLKPGGSLFLLFWSSQKLLPGFPLLEAKLNTTAQATAPFVKGMVPLNHFMNAGNWLQNAGFKNISAKTFIGDIQSPLSDNDRDALNILIQMLWGNSASEIPESDWNVFESISDSKSEKYIANSPNYYGFYTYSMFLGKK